MGILSSCFKDLKSMRTYVAMLAEIMGTFFLVLVACGSCSYWERNGPTPVLQISLGFGFSIATLVWALGHVSGAHFNPAVTIGFLVTRKISIVRAVLYVVGQFLGALAGAGVLDLCTPSGVLSNLGLSTPGRSISGGQTFGIELLITFVLVFTIFSCCDSLKDRGGSIPLTVGLAIAMCHLWAVPYTGAGMNPARVFGPAVVAEHWDEHWAYWAGPIIGGILAALIYDHLFAMNASLSKTLGFLKVDYDDSYFDRTGRKVDISPDVEMH